ncbi:hypothetical protein HY632_03935 [Candidatus Uhrbacteria bacterium]|nr:hypothetical protein [Candidatus Uhrbacteria bacterium]
MQKTMEDLFRFRDFHGMLTRPVLELVDRERLPGITQRILEINEGQSIRYIAAKPERTSHWGRHPTAFAYLRCMDGRVHLPTMTGLPMGLVKPFSAMGGRFEIWWPAFGKRMRNWVHTVEKKYGVACAVLVTYHYSASDPAGERHLGCRGWRYDTAAARAHAERLAHDIGDVFGAQVTPMVTGVETDARNLIFHGREGDVSGAMCIGRSDEEVQHAIAHAFPGMHPQVTSDLVPFLTGNAVRVAEHIDHPRHIEALGHQERIIAIGHGFDYWISEANLAVVVDDADPNLDVPIAAAGAIVAENIAGRLHAEGSQSEEALLLASVPYDTHGSEWNLSVKRAQGLCRYALENLPKEYAHILNGQRLRKLIGVTNEKTKLFEPIAFA